MTVRIPDRLLAELQELCDKEQRSTSEVVRDSLRRYLTAERLRRIRDAARPRAKARGFLTDEDVFKAVS